MAANFSAMNQAIIAYINANIPTDPNKALVGVVSGNQVIIGNKSMSFVPAVNLYFGDGDRVACILPDNYNAAAVVGVL